MPESLIFSPDFIELYFLLYYNYLKIIPLTNWSLTVSYSGGDTILAPLKGELANEVRLRGLFLDI